MPQADRRTRRPSRRRALTMTGALLGCALLLAGCATMPDNGDVSKVAEDPHSDSDPQVQVFGVQPQNNEQPEQIIRGFLEATTSDEARYQTAMDYLTGPAKKWDPFRRITVVSGAMRLTAVHNGADRMDDNGISYTMSASQVAVVDSDNSYTPSSGTYHGGFHLSLVDGQWRIDTLPSGLVLGESDFARIYRSVNMYYYAKLGPDADDTSFARDLLVADPVYVRRRIDPVTSSVKALLDGPSNWVSPVVDSAFPSGTQLQGAKLALDDSGRLRVPLSGLPRQVPRADCDRMAGQLFNTVQDQSSTQVTSVDVERPDGSVICELDHGQAQAFALSRADGRGSQQYFVDTGHRMESVPADGGTAQHVPGPFGQPQAQLRSVAVSRDELTAAGVKSDGRSLYVASLSDSGVAEQHILSSKTGLSAPSWDALDDLWVVDENPASPALEMWRTGHTTRVSVPGLGSDRIQAVRVAADGVRIALLVRHAGHTVLELGRVQRSGSVAHPAVSVTGLRTVAPWLQDVQGVAWAGQSRLVVVGKQRQGVQQLQYVDTDGSAAFTPIQPGISTVTAVAAFEDETRPLLVASGQTLFQLPTDSDWTELQTKGTFPVYPG